METPSWELQSAAMDDATIKNFVMNDGAKTELVDVCHDPMIAGSFMDDGFSEISSRKEIDRSPTTVHWLTHTTSHALIREL